MKAGELEILLGNEAIARGLLENGCTMATSYPGTPASEILSSVVEMARENGYRIHTEWSINEKVAFEVALANSYLGLRSAVSMKQVGLNVAADPLMSSAYTGVLGGFLVISADDPGPYSSQTEQDSRFLAMFAKIPVFDPASPRQAKEMIGTAFELSEKYQLPVMLRPTTRVCHARQDVPLGSILELERTPRFQRDPGRWAATPGFRYQLHLQLNEKLKQIGREINIGPRLINPKARAGSATQCVVASGVALAHVYEIMEELELLERIPLFQVLVPYPLNPEFAGELLQDFDQILVVEETYPVIELQLRHQDKIAGRLTGAVPNAGELDPLTIEQSLRRFLGLAPASIPEPKEAKERPPTLCAGCSHRAAFYAIKKAMPKAIYPSDIGCYTLGLNLGAVDTCLCMGACISQAAGFYHGFARSELQMGPPIVVTIGDSTFFHAGIPALINAVQQGARFILVILDNSTTAMTGFQPTPGSGKTADGSPATMFDLFEIVKACGVTFIHEADPYQLPEFIALIKEAAIYCRKPDGSVAVIIAKHACIMDKEALAAQPRIKVEIGEECNGCRICVDQFECPALIYDAEGNRVYIDRLLCIDCGVCLEVCPSEAIKKANKRQTTKTVPKVHKAKK